MTIKEMREAKNMSQTELAAKSGISRVSINQIERGKRDNMKVDTLIKLASALDISPHELFLQL